MSRTIGCPPLIASRRRGKGASAGSQPFPPVPRPRYSFERNTMSVMGPRERSPLSTMWA